MLSNFSDTTKSKINVSHHPDRQVPEVCCEPKSYLKSNPRPVRGRNICIAETDKKIDDEEIILISCDSKGLHFHLIIEFNCLDDD